MQEPIHPATSMDIFPSRTVRVGLAVGIVGGAMLFTVRMLDLFRGDGADSRTLFGLLSTALLLGYFGWLAYGAWRHPVLHLDPREIRWRPIGGRGPHRVPVAEVTGSRWPGPHDLWIEGGAGSPLRVSMVGIGRSDREAARAWLSDRWVDGGLIA